jgi:hypothetical protein
MKIYIVWQPSYNKTISSHILSICKTKDRLPEAIKMKRSSKLGLLGEFCQLECNGDEYYCTKLHMKRTKEVYFMKVICGGNQKYHETCSIFACPNIDGVINIALYFCSKEHNRDDECSRCMGNQCNDKLIKDLKTKNYSEIDCTNYKGMSFQIWKQQLL